MVSAPVAVGGANNVLKELIEATPERKEEFYSWVKENFDINNDRIELYIENVFIHIVGIMQSSVIAFRDQPEVA